MSAPPSLVSTAEPDFVWTPLLRDGAWSLPTALNLAAFSALAYGPPEGAGAASRVLETLRRRTAQPGRFGRLDTRMVLCTAPAADAWADPYRESRLGVQLFLSSNRHSAVIFVQGTDGPRTVLLDTARAQLSGNGGRNPLKGRRPALERLLTQAAALLNRDMPVGEILDHTTSLLDYLRAPGNRGAHTGFMVLIGAFLHSTSFQQALLAHDVGRKRVFMTGHSLGGALALLLAREMQGRCRRRIHVYTFGCPRVGSPAFVRTIPRRIVHYRMVNDGDPVAWMASGPQWKDHGRLRFLRGDDPPEVTLNPIRSRDWPPAHFLGSYAARLRSLLLHASGYEEDDFPWLDP